jgi:hypothetical protein
MALLAALEAVSLTPTAERFVESTLRVKPEAVLCVLADAFALPGTLCGHEDASRPLLIPAEGREQRD